MRSHVNHKIVFVFRFFVAYRTLELGLDTALESHVAIQRVESRVRVAASRARVARTGSPGDIIFGSDLAARRAGVDNQRLNPGLLHFRIIIDLEIFHLLDGTLGRLIFGQKTEIHRLIRVVPLDRGPWRILAL